MQPTRLTKLRAHSDHLLDLFIGLREKYALLQPLISDAERTQSEDSGHRAHGLSIVRNVLSMSCVLDIAKLAIDKDERTPSIARLVEALAEPELRLQLREDLAVRNIAPTSGCPPDVVELIATSERRDEDQRRAEFERSVEEATTTWQRLEGSPTLQSFGLVRDKSVAHAELHHDGNAYCPFDVTSLGLTWRDLDDAIRELQQLVVLLTALYRGASFAFGMLDEQLSRASRAFWT